MESINNKIRRAVNGDLDAIEFIKEHYLYIGDKFHKENKDKISKEKLYSIIIKCIDEFCEVKVNIPLILYIYRGIISELNARKEPCIEVKKTILLACKGDLNARNVLIKHYSFIVKEKAKNYDYMEYEDLVQFGMIKLIEYIDILISEHQNSEFATTGIGRTIEIYFNKTLKKEVEQWNMPLNYIENDLENFKIEYEFNSIVDGLTTNEKRRDIIKRYFLEDRTYNDLGEKYNMSHEGVRKIIKSYQPQLKKNYLK